MAHQILSEQKAGRHSAPFGPDLLPGMYSPPMHTVPKPSSEKLHMVVDHSASKYSLNSITDPKDITGIKLDGIHSLGVSLKAFRAENPKANLVIFKSDVGTTYHQMPMHFLYQLLTIITVDNEHRVDQCNNIGNCRSQKNLAIIYVPHYVDPSIRTGSQTLEMPHGRHLLFRSSQYPCLLFPLQPLDALRTGHHLMAIGQDQFHINPKSIDSYLSGICNQLEPSSMMYISTSNPPLSIKHWREPNDIMAPPQSVSPHLPSQTYSLLQMTWPLPPFTMTSCSTPCSTPGSLVSFDSEK